MMNLYHKQFLSSRTKNLTLITFFHNLTALIALLITKTPQTP